MPSPENFEFKLRKGIHPKKIPNAKYYNEHDGRGYLIECGGKWIRYGFWKLFYPYSTITAEEGNYSLDGREGHWEGTYKNKSLAYSGAYSKDKKRGYWEYFHPNKKLKTGGEYNKEGFKIGHWPLYSPSEKLIRTNIYPTDFRILPGNLPFIFGSYKEKVNYMLD